MSADHPHPAIRRSYRRVEVIADRVGEDLLVCDRCGHPMVVRSTVVSENPCRDDVRIKCPLPTPDNDHDGCGWWTQHGVRIARETYEREMADRADRSVDAVTTQAPDSSIEERLTALGYLDR